MVKPRTALPLTALPLDHSAPMPLHQQLCNRLREAILNGHLAAGTRLPGTRTLASELGISRNTVLNAFEQLLAEGYVEGKTGAGTFVACTLPETLLHVPPPQSPQPPSPSADHRRLSQRGTEIAHTSLVPTPIIDKPQPFHVGIPALDAFPSAVWARLAARRWRNPSLALLGYCEPAGYRPLREAIAAYLRSARGVQCDVEQVIIVAGSQQAIGLAAHLLLNPGEQVWMENPGYCGGRGAFVTAEVAIVPVPVDQEGLSLETGIARAPAARMVYVTPSHQYPTGVVMSLQRRLALLEWAERSGAWILEDDYDSEFRYTGRPLSALQGLDRAGRVIYLGSFSKVLLPTLRLGYMVVPPDLVEPFCRIRSVSDWQSPAMPQAILADFINDGHFSHHIRRMRTLYAERQAIFREAAEQELAGLLTMHYSETGVNVVGWLPPAADDQAIAAYVLQQHGINTRALSVESIGPTAPGLMMNFGAFDRETIRAGVRRLAVALEKNGELRMGN